MGLLDGLSDAQKALVLFHKDQHSAAAGSLLYKAGDPAEHLFYLISGSVELTAPKAGDAGSHHQIIMPGQIFGETALLPRAVPRIATATVTADATYLQVNSNAVEALRKHANAEAACTLLLNFLVRLSTQLIQYRRVLPLGAKLRLTRHPDYPLEPEVYLKRIAEAVPSGIIARLFAKTRYPKGEILASEGDKLDRFYILREGSIKASSSTGGDVILHAPDIVGQTYLFAGLPSEFTATSIIDSELLPFTMASVREFIRTNPDEGVELLNALAVITVLRLVN